MSIRDGVKSRTRASYVALGLGFRLRAATNKPALENDEMGINKEQGSLQLLSSSDSETVLETVAHCEDIAAQLLAAPEQGSRVLLRVVMLEYSFEVCRSIADAREAGADDSD